MISKEKLELLKLADNYGYIKALRDSEVDKLCEIGVSKGYVVLVDEFRNFKVYRLHISKNIPMYVN